MSYSNSLTARRARLRKLNADSDQIEAEIRLMVQRPVPEFVGYFHWGVSGGFQWDTFASLEDARSALLAFSNGPCVNTELCSLDLYEIGAWRMIDDAKDMEDTGNPFDCLDHRYEMAEKADGGWKVVKA